MTCLACKCSPQRTPLLQGIRIDHLEGPGTESSDFFTTSNYGVETQSRIECV